MNDIIEVKIFERLFYIDKDELFLILEARKNGEKYKVRCYSDLDQQNAEYYTLEEIIESNSNKEILELTEK